jgi:hypothetical protein
MIRFSALSITILAALVLISCASTTEQTSDAARSGFIDDYSKLKPNSEYPGSSDWINNAAIASFSNYNAIIIDPIIVHLSAELVKSGARPDPELMNKVLEYLHSALEREFSKHVKIVRKPGENVIHYRGAITGITTQGGITSNVTNALPVVFVIRTISGQNRVRAQLSMEAVYTDSLTGTLLGTTMQSAGGGAPSRDASGNAQITLDQLSDILDVWANKAAKVLSEALAL